MSGGRERGWGQVRGVLEKHWGQKLEGLVTRTEEDARCPWTGGTGRSITYVFSNTPESPTQKTWSTLI